MLRLLLVFIILDCILLSILLVKYVPNPFKNCIFFLSSLRTYYNSTNKSAELEIVDIFGTFESFTRFVKSSYMLRYNTYVLQYIYGYFYLSKYLLK